MKLNNFLIALAGLFFGASAFAEEAAQAVASTGGSNSGLGYALGFGLAVLGAGMGQGRAASSALEGITRNPQSRDSVFIPMIISLVFIESLVLFMFALAFLPNWR